MGQDSISEKITKLISESKFHVSKNLFSSIDVSILVFFRIVFGGIMLWEVIRYFGYDWISDYWIEPTFHFTYYGFDWVRPLPGDLMYLHFFALGILAIFITIGFKYRVSTVLFFLGFTYMFLLEESRYLNHFYLIVWISLLLIFVPAHKAFSIDALRNKKLKSDTVPAWSLWLLRAQIGIVYFFGGIAKLNYDWLAGEPMRAWLAERTDFPLLGQFFLEEWMVYLFSYGSLLVDLLIVPFLLWKKTRLAAFVIVTTFHILNNELFSIGIFPWFMIFATFLFFSPDLPKKIINFVLRSNSEKKLESFSVTIQPQTKKIILVLFFSFLVIQAVIPLRHNFYPGDVSWTEEGHNFSWHMKLRDKEVSELTFYVIDTATETTYVVDPYEELTSRQVSKMSTRPDMILQYAHHLADVYKKEGYENIQVKVWLEASLNNKEPQLLIDPDVNLAEQPRTLFPKSWIIPLDG